MSDWWHGLWNDPIRENAWVLGVVLAVGLATFGPLLAMMGRSVFGRREQGSVMDDKADEAIDPAASHSGESDVQPLPAVERSRSDAEIDAAAEARWAAEGIPDTQVLTAPHGRMIGHGQVPVQLISVARVECEHCGGVGYMPGINDLLMETVELIGEHGDEVVRLFYAKLLGSAPTLAGLFPPDLLTAGAGTGSAGAAQRDRLLGAIVALADLYDPGVPGKMDRLDLALARFGRSHAAFARPDGTLSGATLEEYAAVKDALFTTLVRFAAENWKAEYAAAWSQAYDYAASVMMTEQIRSGFTAPRFPRQA